MAYLLLLTIYKHKVCHTILQILIGEREQSNLVLQLAQFQSHAQRTTASTLWHETRNACVITHRVWAQQAFNLFSVLLPGWNGRVRFRNYVVSRQLSSGDA